MHALVVIHRATHSISYTTMKATFLFLITFFISLCVSAQLPNTVVSNGYTFQKEWTNDFNGTTTGWHVAEWTFDDNACEFGPSGIAFDDGKLKISISEKTAGNLGDNPEKEYWSGEYWHEEKYLYGRYVVRMKPNTPSGVVTSFFLMNIEWNQDYSQALEWSEIDIEFAGNTDHVQFTLHWIDDNGVKKMDPHTVNLSAPITDDFHEWIIEWTPTYIKYYLDGTLLFTFDDAEMLAQQARPQEIHMNHWVSTSPAWVGVLNESNLPITTTYDQLVYYRLDQTTTSTTNPSGAVSDIWFDTANQQLVLKKSVQATEYVILNGMSSVVQKGKVKGSVINIDNTLPAGVYVVQISTNKGTISEKIVIQ